LLEDYRRDGAPVEKVGKRELVVDSEGRGVAVIETTEVEVKRMGDVNLAFAIDEGEGFETLEDWREAHDRFFTSPEMVAALGAPPVPIDDDTLVVCTRFRVVDTAPAVMRSQPSRPPTAHPHLAAERAAGRRPSLGQLWSYPATVRSGAEHDLGAASLHDFEVVGSGLRTGNDRAR
jgi:uncharacterized protein YhfF